MSEPAWPQEFGHAQFVRLTTFRRNGAAVGTPVWFVPDANALLVTTMASTGKARRLRHTSRVTLCVCDRRGNVQGPEFEATAELLAGAAAADVRSRVTKRYGLQGRVLLAVMHVISSMRSRSTQEEVGIRIVRSALAA